MTLSVFAPVDDPIVVFDARMKSRRFRTTASQAPFWETNGRPRFIERGKYDMDGEIEALRVFAT